VPLVELTAAGGVLMELLAPLASSCSPSPRAADCIDDWLYLPDTLYAFMLIVVVSAGAGPYSLDALSWVC
jgi:hypothetical protein